MNSQLVDIYKKFVYKWIALNEKATIVLADGDSIEEVEKKLKKNRMKANEIRYILPIDKSYAPACQ